MTSACQVQQIRDPATMPRDDHTGSTSSLLLYALLPSLIQRRMPKLRFLRRTISHYETTSCHTRTYSEPTTVVGNITPPPSYQSELEDLDSGTDTTIIYDSMPPTPPRRRRISRPMSSSSGSATPTEESRSGVNWRFADPGFSHLSLAAQEAAALSPSSTFVRRQYIDGVACMLRGLPSDLTAEEELSIREALPPSITATTQSRNLEQALIRAGFGERRPGQVPMHQRSALHQCVALLTLYVFLAVAALLPYLQLFLRSAWRYDREHRISDRVLAKSMEVADVMGKKTLNLAQNFCALHDGKVGDVVKETGIYLVQGFSGGVYDGLGEAIRLRAGEKGDVDER